MTARAEQGVALLLLVPIALAAALLFWVNPAGGKGAGWSGLPLDDGWIHLVYARSLATTLRPEYNPGVLESGMTSPLWAGVNAIAYPLGRALNLPPAVPPKLLSVAFGIASAFLVYRLVRRRAPSPLLAGAAGVLVCLDPGWVFSFASGMEVTLFGACALLAVDAMDRRGWSILGLALGGAVLARPEGLVLVAVVLPLALRTAARESGRVGAWSRILLPLVLPVVAWVAFNLHVSGRPLPNTFYVKAQDASLFRGENLSFLLRRMVLTAPVLRYGIGVVLALGGAVWLGLRRERGGDLVLAVFPFAFLYGLSTTHAFQQSGPFYWARYVHPVRPFLALLVVTGLALAVERVFPARSGRGLLRALVAAVVLAALAIPIAVDLKRQAALFSRNCGDIERANVHLGKWLRDRSGPGDWIASADAGAVRFWSERPVLDLLGLNNGEYVRHRDMPGQILKLRPSWFVLFPDQSAKLVRSLGLEPAEEVANPDYSICDCPSQRRLAIYRASWAPR